MSGERLAQGTRIGDYSIVRALRCEATGVVYAAVHGVLPRSAAIKIVRADRKSLAVSVLREACILDALSHPGVPRIYECGVLADKRPWVASELIEGTSLAERRIAIAELVTVVRAVADILAHAHARGVVHHRLGEGVVVLTPGRAAPVCVRGWGDVVTHDSHVAAEPTSDVYSLGGLGYRALAGCCQDPPAELLRLIDDMLARDPAARPSAAEVCERADWLAETRDTPPLARTESSDFAVRIRG